MALGAEIQIYQAILAIFGNSPIFLGMVVMALGLVILLLLKMPIQAMLPLLGFLGLIVGMMFVGFATILWIMFGILVAFLAYHFARGW